MPVTVGQVADNGLTGVPGIGVISSGEDVAVAIVHIKFASLKIPARRFGSKAWRIGVRGSIISILTMWRYLRDMVCRGSLC